MMKILFYLFIPFLLLSCGNEKQQTAATTNTSAAPLSNFDGFTMTDYSDSNFKKAIKTGDNDIPLERGDILNGKKTGPWMVFYSDGRVKTLSTYVNGILNGIFLEFNDRGQVVNQSYYENNQLHGVKTTFQFGSRKLEECNYIHGKKDGIYRSYDKAGKLQKVIHYKNDLQDGLWQFFNSDGIMTMEYEYKNGEKISGGIVE